ncbi:uncharacterized protein LOC62_03G005199 [Vanrija pseudolonga]|uniref:Uncharacterized protein n=1 Tax=Vanrija pseudolonga TaxID=143232 RepID=A0AAF1BL21_9TREE|nr:hypothetical protein LOC62_03G005199 [Vanrija pseudolonga]
MPPKTATKAKTTTTTKTPKTAGKAVPKTTEKRVTKTVTSVDPKTGHKVVTKTVTVTTETVAAPKTKAATPAQRKKATDTVEAAAKKAKVKADTKVKTEAKAPKGKAAATPKSTATPKTAATPKAPAKPKTPKAQATKAAPKVKAEPKTKAQPKIKTEPKPKAEAKVKAEPKPWAGPRPKQTARKTTGGHALRASNSNTYIDAPPAYEFDENYGGYASEERYDNLDDGYDSDDSRHLIAMIDADRRPWGRNLDEDVHVEYSSDDGSDLLDPENRLRESESDGYEDDDEFGMVDQERREGIDGYWGHDRWGKWGWIEYDDF